MILRCQCLRTLLSIRSFHSSSRIAAKAPAAATPVATSPNSTAAPFPPKSRPEGNDPNYVHPPSSAKAGTALRGVQILRDQPEIIAMPDDFYPDWLWELLDDPADVETRAGKRREIEKKKEIYIARLKDAETEKRLFESMKERVVKPGEKRTLDEKRAVRRAAQAEQWLVNREKQYEAPQFEMPPNRNVKFHKKNNKEKILADNYVRARGMK